MFEEALGLPLNSPSVYKGGALKERGRSKRSAEQKHIADLNHYALRL